jgi:hypothetical protein
MGSHPGRDSDAKSGREKRLADALRANLKRRKAQQRERSAAADRGAGQDGGNDRGESG